MDPSEENVNNGINEVEITSLEQYIERVYEIMKANPPKKLIFRGHQLTTYVLKPGVGRPDLELNVNQEKTIFYEFKRNYKRFYPIDLNNDFDILMLAQHYGLKTRLLDWSYNPFIALYMATEPLVENGREINRDPNAITDRISDGIVYIKKIPDEAPLIEGKEKDPFNISKNTYLVPENFEIRFINQEGLFEIFANPTQESTNHLCYKIKIAGDKKQEIREKLEILGYNELYVYPTLEHLGKQINKIVSCNEARNEDERNEK